jgi:polysaccharide chain length determinant protein (PEP-CTERM system associated)
VVVERTAGPGLQRFLEVPLRRPRLVAVPFVIALLASLAAPLAVEKRYRSSTLILVEKEKVPESFVPKIRGEDAAPRLLTIKQEILSRTRLERIIEELNPYPEQLNRVPLSELVEAIRAATTIAVKGSDAFTVEFVHRDPQTAMQVAGRLASLFIEETVEKRESRVADATEFIESELEEARRQLEGREQALRKFKEEHMGTLPEQTASNLATLQRLQLEQQAVTASLQVARDRLSALELNSTTSTERTGNLEGELARLRGELAVLRSRYTDEHPEVRATLSRIARAEKAAAAAPAQSDPTTAILQQQLAQARSDVDTLKARALTIDRRIASLQARVDEAPRTEQLLSSLSRDHDKLNENYLALLNKKLDAQMAQKLEERWKGERFRILDPAYLPERPISPNATLFLLGGMLVGLAAGLAAAFAVELLDHSVKDAEELEAALQHPVLATIPHISRQAGLRRKPEPLPRPRKAG